MTYDVVYSWGDEGFYFNKILSHPVPGDFCFHYLVCQVD